MLDKQSKQMLKFITTDENLKQGFITFSHFYDIYTTHSGLYEQKVMAIMRYLESQGYIRYCYNQNGTKLGFEVEHKSYNKKGFDFVALKRYILQHWIAFIALILSILSIAMQL